ncbi:hypothetical protein B0H17DRAFT_1072437 [Mycena rosella]|uniref:DUF1772-domain-containing protein n=1 Tax=Mycena rosella TaxID=1033263 RepID=A0AAD7DCP6_MYCRO|nr:hypothetical protein B0H17DRAFT_1072437 [Mycena rosella]
MPNPGHLALVAGLVSSSYFTIGNISNAYFGVMPLTERGKTTLPVAARLKLWNDFYSIAKFHMAASAVASALSLSVAAYTLLSPPLRNLLALGAAASYFIPAFTVVFMLPLNNDLIAKLQADSVKPMELREEQRVLEQLDQWRIMHRVRIACGLVAWGAAVTALLATDKIISFAAN